MKFGTSVMAAARAVGLALVLANAVSACAQVAQSAADTWREEVLLHDGQRLIVVRTVERGGRREVGQLPPIKRQSLTFTIPGTDRQVTWVDDYSEDMGGANFNLRLLEIVGANAYVLTSPAGCLAYNKWGRPNPPYVIFKHENNNWRRIPLELLPASIQTPNLISSSPDQEAKKAANRLISAEMIREHVAGYRQPEYKTILRHPVTREMCPQYSSGPRAPLPIAPLAPSK